MARRTIVIVGAALGGPTAARSAREEDPDARIVLLERAEELNPVACALAQLVSGEAAPLRRTAQALASSLRRDHGVQVRTGQEVTALDPSRRRLTANGKELRYDSLVWAAGAESALPAVRGLKAVGRDPQPANVARFRTLRDFDRIEAQRRAGGGRAAVLGGGYIGVEAADALRRAGFEVHLLERGRQLLPEFPAALAKRLRAALEGSGVKVRLSAEVQQVRLLKGRVTALELARGKTLPVDLVVIAAGVQPRTGAPAKAGAAVDGDGALVIDAHAATSLPGVFACGVCAAVPDVVTGRSKWSAQAAVADKTARVAGACAAGADLRLSGFAGSALVRGGDLVLGRAGLTAEEAEAHAPGAVAEVGAEGPARDAMLAEAGSLTVGLRFHRGSGRVLGGEIVGTVGVDKRVDVLATALVGGLGVEQLAQLDLGFSPPFASVTDPLNLAAAAASRARARA